MFIELHITAQSDPVLFVILCDVYACMHVCVCVCVCIY